MIFYVSCCKRAGFTLIEIMIVIAIIAILAGVAIPNIYVARQESLLRACADNAITIGTAIAQAQIRNSDTVLYEKFFGSKPSGSLSECIGDEILGEDNFLVKQGYLSKAIRCPSNNGYYHVAYNNPDMGSGSAASLYKHAWFVMCYDLHSRVNREDTTGAGLGGFDYVVGHGLVWYQ